MTFLKWFYFWVFIFNEGFLIISGLFIFDGHVAYGFLSKQIKAKFYFYRNMTSTKNGKFRALVISVDLSTYVLIINN